MAFMLSACDSSTDTKTSEINFGDSILDIQYPVDWTSEDAGDNFFTFTDSSSIVRIALSRMTIGLKDGTINELEPVFKENIENTPDIKITQVEQIRVSNYTAIKYFYEKKNNDKTFYYYWVYILDYDYTYLIIYKSGNSNMQSNMRDLNKILGSVTILKIANVSSTATEVTQPITSGNDIKIYSKRTSVESGLITSDDIATYKKICNYEITELSNVKRMYLILDSYTGKPTLPSNIMYTENISRTKFSTKPFYIGYNNIDLEYECNYGSKTGENINLIYCYGMRKHQQIIDTQGNIISASGYYDVNIRGIRLTNNVVNMTSGYSYVEVIPEEIVCTY